MTKSNYTKSLIIKRNIFAVLSFLIMIATCLSYLIIAISGHTSPGGELQTKIGTIAYTFGISLLILIALLIIVGHKVRTSIWMMTVILGSYLYGTTGMWVTFALWIVDEYALYNLYQYFKNKVSINVEIDKRECK